MASKYDKDHPPQLPPGWVAVWDSKYDTFFFVNEETKESTWELPKEAAIEPPSYEQSQTLEQPQTTRPTTLAPEIRVNNTTTTTTTTNASSTRPSRLETEREEESRRRRSSSGLGNMGMGLGGAALGGALLSGILASGSGRRSRYGYDDCYGRRRHGRHSYGYYDDPFTSGAGLLFGGGGRHRHGGGPFGGGPFGGGPFGGGPFGGGLFDDGCCGRCNRRSCRGRCGGGGFFF